MRYLLFAEGTGFFLKQPLLDAVHMEAVFARQLVDLLALLNVIVADRAHLLQPLGLYLFNPSELLLSDSLRNVPYFLLQLEQLLIGHIVRIDFYVVLVPHPHNHVPQVLHVHHAYFLV
jgi:hypothetical protein